MRKGNLILYGDLPCKVVSVTENSGTIQSWTGASFTLNHDDPTLSDERSTSSWPVAMAPKMGAAAKRIRGLTRVVRGVPVELTPYVDWTPGHYLQKQGGPIFFCPTLNLRVSEVLALHYDVGTAKVVIPFNFRSVDQQQQDILDEKAAKIAAKKTAFSNVLSYLNDVEDDA